MSKSLFTLVITLSVQFLYTQNIDLNIFSIPDSIANNANSVVRFENIDVEISSQTQKTTKIKRAITIYNKYGDRDGIVYINYDKNTKVKNLKIESLNALGLTIKKVKSKEIKDYSAVDGFSLYNDGRVLYYAHVPIAYPYTIKYEYEIESSNTAFISPWYPIKRFYQAIQKSTFTITYPEALVLNKLEGNLSKYDILFLKEGNKLIYTANNIKAVEQEPYSPSMNDYFPQVNFALNKFNLEGVKGEATTWKEFGDWMHSNLIKETLNLSESTKSKIKNLVAGIDDPIERAKIIYAYMQNKTRYISVQVGIGGWKPMLASEVDKLGYGDCKALVNYTKALMDAADVESYYTVIKSSKNKSNIKKDLVSVQGNHIILYLPNDDDDIWLECTSQQVPFGYIGSSTDDRDAFVVKPNGSEIKHTKIYQDTLNTQNIKSSYAISESGSINGSVSIISKGTQYLNRFNLIDKPKRETDESYKEFWDNINNLNITNSTITNNKQESQLEENIVFNASNYATISVDRMLFSVNALNKYTYVPKRIRNRKLPLEITRGFLDTDEVEIELPTLYSVEAFPNNKTIDTKFGTYEIKFEKLNDNKIKYTRKFIIKSGEHPKEEYKKYRDFIRDIVKYDNSKIVLIKK